MGDILVQDAQEKIAIIPTVGDVRVQLVFDPPWNQSMMSDEAKLAFVNTRALLWWRMREALDPLSTAPIREVVVANTLRLPEEKRFPTLTVLSIADLLARAIQYTHSNESVSQLFG